MSETKKVEYDVQIVIDPERSAFDGKYVRLLVTKMWPSLSLKVRGSELWHGASYIPYGRLCVKFPIEGEGEEITVEQFADILEQMVNGFKKSFETFVMLEDDQDSIREEDF